jgi:hypothetical protein
MLKMADWATERCEIHDMVSCADCLDRNKLRRTETGEIAYRDDCAIRTVAEITGLDYEFSAEVIREAGTRPGSGSTLGALVEAFRSVGSTVQELTRIVRLDEAVSLSRSGRTFAVAGWAGRDGHAWTIKDGQQLRHYLRNRKFSYRIFEILP